MLEVVGSTPSVDTLDRYQRVWYSWSRTSRCGEIGRRAGFRYQFLRECRFDSCHRHMKNEKPEMQVIKTAGGFAVFNPDDKLIYRTLPTFADADAWRTEAKAVTKKSR